MAYKQYKSPFTKPQDPPPGDEKERGGKIKAWVEKQDAKIEANHPKLHASLSYANPFSNLNLGMKKNKQESTPETKEPVETEEKKGPSAGDKLKTRITTSNFVKKHRKLNMALTNMFHGTKAGKDTNVSGGEQLTPRQIYRDTVKDWKKYNIRNRRVKTGEVKINPKTGYERKVYEVVHNPLFSQERILARKELRGRYSAKIDSKTGKIVNNPNRLSEKNRAQQIMSGKERGAKISIAGPHQPFIPEIKGSGTQMLPSNINQRQANREIASNAVSREGVGVLKEQGFGGNQQGSCPKGNCTKPEDNPSKK